MSTMPQQGPVQPDRDTEGDLRSGRLPAMIATIVWMAITAQVVSSRASGVLFWILSLAGLASLLIGPRQASRSHTVLREYWFWLLVLAPVAMNMVSVLAHRLPARELTYLPLLAAPGLVLAAQRWRIDLRPMLLGSALGAVIALVIAAWGVWMLGEARPGPPGMNQIIFGQFIVVFAVICAASIGEQRDVPGWIAPVGLLAAVCALFFASFLGGLLVLPVMLALLFRQHWCAGRARKIWMAGVAGLLMMLAVFAGRPSVYDRMHDMSAQVASWREGRVDKSSAGTRIELAMAAIRLVQERPWFGIGARRFQAGLVELRERGVFPGDVQLMRHAHNTYLNLLVEYGLVGFLLMTAMVALLWRALGRADRLVRIAGRSLLLTWLLLGLTNDVLAHQTTMRSMVLVFSLFLACLTHRYNGGDDRQSAQIERS